VSLTGRPQPAAAGPGTTGVSPGDCLCSMDRYDGGSRKEGGLFLALSLDLQRQTEQGKAFGLPFPGNLSGR
jgi:hypothetical protein